MMKAVGTGLAPVVAAFNFLPHQQWKKMDSRFRKELTVIPPVQIAVSRRGIATTIDWRSERADRGLSGYSHSFRSVGDPSRAGPLPTDRFLIPGTRQDFGGGDLAKMTSTGLDGFKELLLATREREREIRSDVTKARWQVALSWAARAFAWGTLAPAVSKSVRSKVNTAVAVRRAEVANLKKNLAASRISVSFDMETAVAGPHLKMLNAFDRLSSSSRSWALQTSQQIDRVKARSAAGTVISRRVLSIGRRSDPLVDTNDLPLAVSIQNGHATAFFYPGFIFVNRRRKVGQERRPKVGHHVGCIEASGESLDGLHRPGMEAGGPQGAERSNPGRRPPRSGAEPRAGAAEHGERG